MGRRLAITGMDGAGGLDVGSFVGIELSIVGAIKLLTSDRAGVG